MEAFQSLATNLFYIWLLFCALMVIFAFIFTNGRTTCLLSILILLSFTFSLIRVRSMAQELYPEYYQQQCPLQQIRPIDQITPKPPKGETAPTQSDQLQKSDPESYEPIEPANDYRIFQAQTPKPGPGLGVF